VVAVRRRVVTELYQADTSSFAWVTVSRMIDEKKKIYRNEIVGRHIWH
jgi:hypothetical protein